MCGFERTARPDNGGPLMPSEDTDQIAARIAQKLRDAGSSAILYPAPTATTLGAIRRDRVVVVVSLALLASIAPQNFAFFSPRPLNGFGSPAGAEYINQQAAQACQ